MTKPCCKSLLVRIREHVQFVAGRVEHDFPKASPEEALLRLASTIESAVTPGPDVAQSLGRVSGAIAGACPSCGGTGRS